MELSEYKNAIAEIPYGKRLPSTLYVFLDGEADLGPTVNRLLQQIVAAFNLDHEYNVVKFRTNELKVSFLSYPDFFDDPHPALSKSATIDLCAGKIRHASYSSNPNPPVLHRKETFLPSHHPQRPQFAHLTDQEEQAGLLERADTIGFKLNWERRLAERGFALDGHSLRRFQQPEPDACAATENVEIHRHKTALTRYDLSKPVKSLLEYGLLSSETTIFDYGCGQGTDVSGLQALGYSAHGWDPIHQPETSRTASDVVNLGYVLNVIEDPAERLEALVDAYRHTKRLLVVSALISEHLDRNATRAFGDGLLTKRNTFQKFYEQSELQQYIEDALETTATPVALGVFYVFRDPAEQQDFLSARSRRKIDWTAVTAKLGLGEPPTGQWEALYREHTELLSRFGKVALEIGRLPGPEDFEKQQEVCEKLGSPKRALRAFVQGGGAPDLIWAEVAHRFGSGVPLKRAWERVYEQHRELLDMFWDSTLQNGRAPSPEEFPRTPELFAAVGSPKRALSLLLRRGGHEALQQASEERQKDLLVYLAMSNLRRKIPFGHLSLSLRLDIREFFSNYTRALEKGLELLYAAGDPGEIELACEGLDLGWQDEQALYAHRNLIETLPPVLRAYVGCATTLFGDISQADIVKIHKSSGKVTFLAYDDFEGKNLPELQHRTKVNLRTRWVETFDHSQSGQCLYFKERFLRHDHPAMERMKTFSAKLRKLGISEEVGFGPTVSEFNKLLGERDLNANLNQKRKKPVTT